MRLPFDKSGNARWPAAPHRDSCPESAASSSWPCGRAKRRRAFRVRSTRHLQANSCF